MTAAATWDERAPTTRASAAHFVWIAFAVLAIASFAVPDGTIPSWLKEIPPGGGSDWIRQSRAS